MDLCLLHGRDVITREYLIRGHPSCAWGLTICLCSAADVFGGGNAQCTAKDYRSGLESGTNLATMASVG